jgi:hypothetical protein
MNNNNNTTNNKRSTLTSAMPGTTPHAKRTQRHTKNGPASKAAERAQVWDQFARDGLPASIEGRLEPFLGSDAARNVATVAEEITSHLATGIDPSRMIDLFLAEPDTITDRRERYAALRAIELLVPRTIEPLARPLWIARQDECRRPLTPIELGVVRMCACTTVHALIPVGLLDSGCASGELAVVPADEIDRDHLDRATHINAPGTLRDCKSGYPPCRPRRLTVPSWCATKLGSVAAALPCGSPVAYFGHSSDPAKAQSAVLMNVRAALAAAGLGSDPTVKPLSIRNGAARAVYEQHGLEAAFKILGHKNKNLMASEIGLHEDDVNW